IQTRSAKQQGDETRKPRRGFYNGCTIITSTRGPMPMNIPLVHTSRRRFLSVAALGAAYFTTPGLFADEVALIRTPDQTEGPFYPTKLPLDTDNDLLIINDAMTPAVGKITHLSGRILDAKGQPVRNALVEI